MGKEQTTIRSSDEVREFIKFLKELDERQQVGIDLIIEGLKLSAKEKSGKSR